MLSNPEVDGETGGKVPPQDSATEAPAPQQDEASEAPAETPPPEPPAEMDTVPVVRTGEVLKLAPQEGQLFEACPACGTLMDVTDQEPFAKIHCPSCGQALRARKQFNHYRLIELIGQGGMGNVFKATDCNLNRLVALKVLKKELASKPEEIEKLAAESRITASINHPHVVKVFSFGQDHGQFYMAMELVERGSLDDLLTLQRRVPEAQVLEVAIQIAQGLEAALDHELIHRDIKPGNILFADAHTAKLVDFGLAIVMDQAAAAVGEIWGTPYYIAPEKLDNQPEDFRSDIYSLGGTLFHALAGRPPYEADTASMVALKQLKSQPVSLQSFAPEVSSETAYVINRMLAKNPADRYDSYTELIEHLSYARGKLIERIKRPPQPKARVVVEDDKTRRFTGFISLGLLVAAVLAGVTLYAFRETLFPSIRGKAATTFVAADFDAQFDEAVAMMVELRFDEAREAFRALADTAGSPQPRLNWARMNQALATLLSGDRIAAAKMFDDIRAVGLYTTEEPGLKYADFFVEASRILSKPDNPIDSRTARLYSTSNFEAFAILCFAAHNWEAGHLSEAEPMFRIFSRSRAPQDEPWMAQYRNLANIFLADAEIVSGLRKKADAAADPVAREEARNEIDAARARIRTGTRASEQLDQISESLEKAAPKRSP